MSDELLKEGDPPSAQTPPRSDPRVPQLQAVIDTDPNWPPLPGVRALQVLLSHLGECETAPNQGPIVEWAARRWAGAEWWAENYPQGNVLWCAGAVCTAFEEAGVRIPGSLSCDALVRLLRRAGWLVWSPSQRSRTIEPGDIAFFGQPLDLKHCGLVESCLGGRLFTVEGNHGDGVRRNTYELPAPRLAWLARHPL